MRALLALSDLGIDRRKGAAAQRRPSPTGLLDRAWVRWIEAQGGTADEGALPVAPVVQVLEAPRAGYVAALGAVRVGNAAVHLGAGRRTKEDEIDHAVGVVVHAKRGDRVENGEPLATIHARTDEEATAAGRELVAAYTIGDEPPPDRPGPGPRSSSDPTCRAQPGPNSLGTNRHCFADLGLTAGRGACRRVRRGPAPERNPCTLTPGGSRRCPSLAAGQSG